MAHEVLLEKLAENPSQAAILLDVDGTLAPIVARPEIASVPEETRAEIRRLVDRYALVALVSGRTGEDARALVGVDGAEYVGVHGLELSPEAERWRGPLQEFASSVSWPTLDNCELAASSGASEPRRFVLLDRSIGLGTPPGAAGVCSTQLPLLSLT